MVCVCVCVCSSRERERGTAKCCVIVIVRVGTLERDIYCSSSWSVFTTASLYLVHLHSNGSSEGEEEEWLKALEKGTVDDTGYLPGQTSKNLTTRQVSRVCVVWGYLCDVHTYVCSLLLSW